MADWKPPKFGSPSWIGIPATDVSRAHAFYAAVFDWKFKDETPDYPRSELAMFDFNPDVSLSGGIQKSTEGKGTFRPGLSGTCIYWFVEDVEAIGVTIENAGGKMLTAAEKEGKSGLYRFFQDTEGNIGGVYQMVSAA